MEKKIEHKENVPTLEKIKKDFEDGAMQAIKRGELTREKFIESFRKDMSEIMGRIAVAVERKDFEKKEI